MVAQHLDQADPDLLRAMVRAFAETLMSAEADALCGAGYGERSPERVNQTQRAIGVATSTPGPAPSSWRCPAAERLLLPRVAPREARTTPCQASKLSAYRHGRDASEERY